VFVRVSPRFDVVAGTRLAHEWRTQWTPFDPIGVELVGGIAGHVRKVDAVWKGKSVYQTKRL
jgi:hypothetical protein